MINDRISWANCGWIVHLPLPWKVGRASVFSSSRQTNDGLRRSASCSCSCSCSGPIVLCSLLSISTSPQPQSPPFTISLSVAQPHLHDCILDSTPPTVATHPAWANLPSCFAFFYRRHSPSRSLQPPLLPPSPTRCDTISVHSSAGSRSPYRKFKHLYVALELAAIHIRKVGKLSTVLANPTNLVDEPSRLAGRAQSSTSRYGVGESARHNQFTLYETAADA